jgi:PAS domain S-box-containing protein
MQGHIPPSADDRLSHLNEVLRTFRSITRETDPDRMLEKACQMLTETRGYFHAWIQLTDAREKTVKVFQAGPCDPFSPLEEKLMNGGTVHCIDAALKTPGVIVIDNRHQSCQGCPFFLNCRDGHGLVSRLEYKKRIFGTLTVYSEHHFLESPVEHEFIADVASDIAYSLFNIEQAEIRSKEQDALKDSEERYRQLFENSASGVAVYEAVDDGKNFIFKEFNKKAEEIEQKNRADVIGRRITDAFPGVEAFGLFELLQRVRATGKSEYMAEALYRDAADPGTWRENRVYKLPTGEIVAVYNDITERKTAEAALMEGAKRHRAIFRNFPDAIFIADTETGQIVDANPAASHLLKMPVEKIIGLHQSQLHPQVMLNEAREIFRQHQADAEKNQPSSLDESFILRSDGVQVPVEIKAQLVPFAGKQYLQGVFRDITKRKTAEREIAKLSQAVAQSPASIVITGLDGSIEYINPKFTQITGYTLDEVRGRNPNILKSDTTSPEEYKQLWATISGGDVWEGEFHNKTKDGKSFWEKATIAPIFNEKKEIINYLAVKKDITEQKALEAQLRQSQKMEAIGLLAGGVAHDFNNLLTIINGYSGIILADLDRSNPVFEKVKQIMAAGERAASLTRQLLAFSRKQVLRPEILDINKLIIQMETLLRRLIGEDIDLVMLYSDHLKPVKADQGQLEQVIMNLVVNARDAMPTGGCLTFETKNVFLDKSYTGIHPETKSGEYVMFSITDTGMGMDEKTCDHIFDPFFTTKEVGKGTGLGLSTVYGIVRQSKGIIRVFSEPGKGTTFKIFLPISESADLAQKQSAGAALSGGSETILVVEDEESVRSLTVLALNRQGYQVFQAENGVEALEIIEKNADRIQLVMTDMVMPQMGGPELAEKIIKTYPHIRLLFLSGYSDQLAVSHGIQGKKIDFIQKPFSMHQLAQKVRETLDRQ